jgi:hypothetical protein
MGEKKVICFWGGGGGGIVLSTRVFGILENSRHNMEGQKDKAVDAQVNENEMASTKTEGAHAIQFIQASFAAGKSRMATFPLYQYPKVDEPTFADVHTDEGLYTKIEKYMSDHFSDSGGAKKRRVKAISKSPQKKKNVLLWWRLGVRNVEALVNFANSPPTPEQAQIIPQMHTPGSPAGKVLFVVQTGLNGGMVEQVEAEMKRDIPSMSKRDIRTHVTVIPYRSFTQEFIDSDLPGFDMVCFDDVEGSPLVRKKSAMREFYENPRRPGVYSLCATMSSQRCAGDDKAETLSEHARKQKKVMVTVKAASREDGLRYIFEDAFQRDHTRMETNTGSEKGVHVVSLHGLFKKDEAGKPSNIKQSLQNSAKIFAGQVKEMTDGSPEFLNVSDRVGPLGECMHGAGLPKTLQGASYPTVSVTTAGVVQRSKHVNHLRAHTTIPITNETESPTSNLDQLLGRFARGKSDEEYDMPYFLTVVYPKEYAERLKQSLQEQHSDWCEKHVVWEE